MKTFVFAAAVALVGTVAQAQEFYAGAVYDLVLPHSGEDASSVDLLGGVRFGDGQVSYGAEADLGLSGDADYSSMRLRGIVRNDMGRYALLGSIGYTSYDLDAGGTTDGYNFSLGGDIEITPMIDLRLEVMRDMMSDYSTNVTNVRIGSVYNF